MPADDTICALSTPPGESAIGIIRISGQQAIPIAQRVFQKKPAEPLEGLPTHTIHYGILIDPGTGEALDEALLSLLRRPRTYTREDMVEIGCHGGPLLLSRVVSVLVRCGARIAEPGEFTRRAFLNGRIDLTQAEAVMDLISSKAEAEMKVALGQLEGRLGNAVKALRDQLLSLLTQIEANIDFCEQDIQVISSDDVKKILGDLCARMQEILKSKQEGRIVREGLVVAIVGRPNVGKSSLLNALLEEDRAIVSSSPGTTRDLLEGWVSIHGMATRLIDTAGLRNTEDPVELEGVRRALEAVEKASLILVIIDSSQAIHRDDRDLLDKTGEKNKIIVLNKSDLKAGLDESIIRKNWSKSPVVRISATQHTGLDLLKDTIQSEVFKKGLFGGDYPFLVSSRHAAAIEKALLAVGRAISGVEEGVSHEFLALDIRLAIDHLGEITGAITTDDLLDQIFKRFCLGK